MSNLSFELPFPPSVNNYYRHIGVNKVLISAKGRDYQKQVKSLLVGLPTIKGDVHLSGLFCPPDRRRRDLDNFDGKALWDSLTKAGVWLDDCQVKSRYSAWGDIIKGGRVFIEIHSKGKDFEDE